MGDDRAVIAQQSQQFARSAGPDQIRRDVGVDLRTARARMFASTRNAANSPPTNWISSDATIGPDRLPFGFGEVHVVFAGTPAVRLNPVHEVCRGCPPDGRRFEGVCNAVSLFALHHIRDFDAQPT
jgi:hypothetical protein